MIRCFCDRSILLSLLNDTWVFSSVNSHVISCFCDRSILIPLIIDTGIFSSVNSYVIRWFCDRSILLHLLSDAWYSNYFSSFRLFLRAVSNYIFHNLVLAILSSFPLFNFPSNIFSGINFRGNGSNRLKFSRQCIDQAIL